MKRDLPISLAVAVILIGGALWYRLSTSNTIEYGLVTVGENQAPDISYEEFLGDFLKPTATSSSAVASADAYSNTDAISRQLFMDYLSLESKDQINTASLTTLTDKYVESLPNLIQSESIDASDIKTVPNSQINFQSYADALTEIYNKHAQTINSVKGVNFDRLSPELYAFTDKLAVSYKSLADEIKTVAVPQTLLSLHLKLVNNYLSSASASASISKADDDTALAFSGLIGLHQNMESEKSILLEIEKILNANGI
jgi:hypothetical protein